MQPSEFWALPIRHWWWEYESQMDQLDAQERAGNNGKATRRDMARARQRLRKRKHG